VVGYYNGATGEELAGVPPAHGGGSCVPTKRKQCDVLCENDRILSMNVRQITYGFSAFKKNSLCHSTLSTPCGYAPVEDLTNYRYYRAATQFTYSPVNLTSQVVSMHYAEYYNFVIAHCDYFQLRIFGNQSVVYVVYERAVAHVVTDREVTLVQ